MLLQAIARVNRPYVDANAGRKRVGLVVDFVGVLGELKKALRFDSEDVSGVIEGLDRLMEDFLEKIRKAKVNYLTGEGDAYADEHLERIVYGRFLDPELREEFFVAYKEIEALWEILSPSPELRDHIEAFGKLARLYTTVRNAYAKTVHYQTDLAQKTRRMVQEGAVQYRLGDFTKTVTFDADTLATLRGEAGPKEAKVFNLVRGLRQEIENQPELEPILIPLKERAEGILQDLERRRTDGLAAMDLLMALAREKEAAVEELKNSGLEPRAFGVYWTLKNDEGLRAAGIDPMELARDTEALLNRFPHAAVNAEEKRRLRADLYKPLLSLAEEERRTIVARILVTLFGGECRCRHVTSGAVRFAAASNTGQGA